MKTLCVLFIFLSILNFPVYMIFSSTTVNNDYSIDTFYQYFTLGNLGRTNPECGFSNIRQPMDPDLASLTPPPTIQLKCDTGYIKSIKRLGLLYVTDT
mmetsp:Transcript_24596/g.38199  ORF Transcript_24596/g.38199 Transcript_24596/m.38199 type:complete len:98 (-) Transcript_24596:5890-6183(-)